MKIGMPIIAEYKTLDQHINLCRELGFDFIELNMGCPCSMPHKIDWKAMKDCKDIFFTVHLPESLQVGELYEPARKREIDYIMKLIKLFRTNGDITKFTLHFDAGIVMTLTDRKVYMFEEYKEDYLNSLRKSFKTLSKFAAKLGVTICFENTWTYPFLLEGYQEILKWDNLFFVLDAGHDERSDKTASKFFMKHPNRIKHIHMHDFDGSTDHKELGTGKVNVGEYVKFCQANNLTMLLEVRTKKELERSFKMLKFVIKTLPSLGNVEQLSFTDV